MSNLYLLAKSTSCASGQTGLVVSVLLQLKKKTCFFSAFLVYPFALFLSLRLHSPFRYKVCARKRNEMFLFFAIGLLSVHEDKIRFVFSRSKLWNVQTACLQSLPVKGKGIKNQRFKIFRENKFQLNLPLFIYFSVFLKLFLNVAIAMAWILNMVIKFP